MFERFTDQARRVVVLAQEEARRLDRHEIADDLLLIGIAAQPDGTGGRVLAEVGADAERLRERIQAVVGSDRKHRSGHLPFTSTAKNVLEGALRAAMGLGAREIGTEHLLIALTKVDGAGVDVLRGLGVDVDELRNRTMRATSADRDTATVEETQATPWSTPRADVEAQLAGIESALQQILVRLTAIEKRLPEQ
ncbi:MAG TPA: Clp protease N-terminal domain-containing protein [Pseudonocardiaceae bacterium]|jgi:ATP-dependent Clp protease ATP-binding subunit ClpC